MHLCAFLVFRRVLIFKDSTITKVLLRYEKYIKSLDIIL